MTTTRIESRVETAEERATWEAVERALANAKRPTATEDQTTAFSATALNSEPPGWPSSLAPEALHGIAGEFVRMIEPNTEADPAAILVQFLVAFGALVGRGPHFRVEGDHPIMDVVQDLVSRRFHFCS